MRTKIVIGLATVFIWCELASEGQSQFLPKPLDNETTRQTLAVGGKLGALIKQGISEAQSERYSLAISSFTKALEMNPPVNVAAMIHYNRAIVYGMKGQHQESIRDNTEAIRLDPRRVDAYHNRGVDYSAIGKVDEALADYGETIRIDTTGRAALNAYFGRAEIYKKRGQIDKAVADYKQTTRYSPTYPEAFSIRGNAFCALSNYEAAASDYAKAAKMAPTNGHVLDYLAWFKATCPKDSLRDGKAALQIATSACQLTKWQDADCIDTLAGAYAEVGDFEKAIKYQEQVFSRPSVSAAARKDYQQHLASYRGHKPWRNKPLIAQ